LSVDGGRAQQRQRPALADAKCGNLVGVLRDHHQVSIKHPQRYLNEFGYRFNRREDADLFEQTVSRLCAGKTLPYAKLVEENAFTPFVRPS
jgi:hypothetical protein